MSNPVTVTLSGNSTPLLPNPFAPAFMGNVVSVPILPPTEPVTAEIPEVMTTPCPGCGRIGTVHTGTCPTRFTDQPKTPEAHENQYLHAELVSLRARLAEAEARAKCAEEAVRVLGWCVRRRRERDKDETKAWLRDEVIEADWSVDANPAARAAVEGAR